MPSLTTTAPALTTATQAEPSVSRGFPGLHCLSCGEEDTTRVSLDDMTFVCTACEAESTPEEALAIVATWQQVLAWIGTAPPC